DEDTRLFRRVSDPLQLLQIELHAGHVEQELSGNVSLDGGDDGAVLWRDVGHAVRGQDRACSTLISNDDAWTTRYVLTKIAGDNAGAPGVAAADVDADDDQDRLVSVEVGERCLSVLRLRAPDQTNAQEAQEDASRLKCRHESAKRSSLQRQTRSSL